MEPQIEPNPSQSLNSITLVGARVTWTLVGPLVLILLTIGIITSGTGWLTWLDATFGLVVALMIAGRWVEQRSGRAQTATGGPSTMANYRRYVVGLVPFALIVWVIANLVGNHCLGSG